MFIRLLRDTNVGSGVVLRNGQVYDVPRDRGDALVASGAAALVSSDPGEYRPDAVAITGGTISGTPIGGTARAAGEFTTLAMTRTDSSGTPGNVTNNSALGRAAFAAAGTSVVVTNSTVTATSEVFVQLRGAADATLTSCRVTASAAGSFTVLGLCHNCRIIRGRVYAEQD